MTETPASQTEQSNTRGANPDGPVVVTGASGFVGRALVTHLAGQAPVRACFRRIAAGEMPANASAHAIGDLTHNVDWSAVLDGANAVIHTAARVHQLGEDQAIAADLYRRVNVDATLALASAAAAAGVRRFVFLSSIKVNGDDTAPGQPFTAADTPRPTDAYGRSKLEAEKGLARIARETGLEVVILRPPLIYGPGVKGNLARLVRLVRRRVPLPLGAIDNRRSLLSLENLCSAIGVCLSHPAAVGHTFLVADSDDLSTPQLVREIGQALGIAPMLVPIPVPLLRLAGALSGRSAEVNRLTGWLQVDAFAITSATSWMPARSSVAASAATWGQAGVNS